MTTTTVSERLPALELRSLKSLEGYTVRATDGEVGRVADFYFDDVTWTLRYFVVETGSWLDKRRVLVSPQAFEESNGAQGTITTTLTREMIETGPHEDVAKPVSRQFEIKLHEHFAWPIYWINAPEVLQGDDGDSHLRSVSEVLGYGIRAKDGGIGHVEDLIAEQRAWVIRHLVIDTRNWLPGREVLVSPMWIADVSWAESKVTVDLTRDTIRRSPEYDPTRPVDRSYEEQLYHYYGRPGYWR